jgi:hypothetical protein
VNILLLLAHSIEEYDQVSLFHGLGYDVFSIGAYTDPAHPTDDKRPALPEVPYHADLAALVEGDQFAHKSHLPDGLIDWADVIIAHHFLLPHQLSPDGPVYGGAIAGNWDRIRHKRVIWRTVGQSLPGVERDMRPFVTDGLQVVRYSPKERDMALFAGESALIRFYKDPAEWQGWTGELHAIGNITQHLMQRGDATHGDFWREATKSLPTMAAGPGSEETGGIGVLPYDEMRDYLRRVRAYCYTGTQPASYTLGLIEAMMTGTPVVSIGPMAWGSWGYPELFEAHELASYASNDPVVVRTRLSELLADDVFARQVSAATRQRALAMFGRDVIGAQWRDFLGAP